MPQASLKFVPLGFFVQVFTPTGKWVFYSLVAMLALAAGLMVLNFHFPTEWVSSIETVTDSRTREVALERGEHGFREFTVWAKASFNFASYYATTMEPNFGLLVVFGLLQAVGWSALLAASANMRGGYSYVVWAFFGANVFWGNYASGLFGTDPLQLVTLAILMLFLCPAFLFKNRLLNWGLPAQMCLYTSIHLSLFVVCYIAGGWAQLHQAIAFPFFVQAVLAAVFIGIAAKDIGNAIFYITTNTRADAGAPKTAQVLGLYALAIAGLALLALEANQTSAHDDSLWVQPVHILAVLGVFTVYFSQNGYGQLADILPSNFAYTIMILGLGLVSFGFWGYHFGHAEYSLRYEGNRLAANLLLGFTFGHFIYILINFRGALAQGLRLFWVLYRPSVFRFYPFIFLVLLLALGVELLHPYQGENHLKAAFSNVRADNSLLHGDFARAAAEYRRSGGLGLADAKGYYNSAQLLLADPRLLQDREKQSDVRWLYTEATRRHKLIHAALNNGNFLLLLNQPAVSIGENMDFARAYADPRLLVNVAGTYFRINQPDSAIAKLVAAGELNPNNPIVFSNLGAVYLSANKPGQAHAYLQTAYELAPKKPPVLENYYFYILAYDTAAVEILAKTDTLPSLFGYNLNRGLFALRQKQFSTANAIAQTLNQTSQSNSESALLQLLTQASLDSTLNVLSRLAWINQYHPGVAPYANHATGVYFFRRGMPEMALQYFTASANQGWAQDSLWIGAMEADRGNPNGAYKVFQEILSRNYPDHIRTPAAHEAALLDYAFGTEPRYLVWDMADISRNESFRLARYAGYGNNLERATAALEFAARADSADIRPFIELARIAAADTATLDFAQTQVQAGIQLTRQPNHPGALLQLARIQLLRNQPDAAHKTLEKLNHLSASDSLEAAILRASLLVRENKAQQALDLLRPFPSRWPYHHQLALAVSGLWLQTNQILPGFEFMASVIERNRAFAPYWERLSEFQRRMGRHSDALESLSLASEYSFSEHELRRLAALKTAVADEAFEAERDFYRQQAHTGAGR